MKRTCEQMHPQALTRSSAQVSGSVEGKGIAPCCSTGNSVL